MRRQALDGAPVGTPHQGMQGRCGLDPLQVAIGPGMVVGPGDRRGFEVVALPALRLRLGIDGLEVLRRADRAEPRQAGAQVLMVAGQEQAAATRAGGGSIHPRVFYGAG
jgi:hypothetical protein